MAFIDGEGVPSLVARATLPFPVRSGAAVASKDARPADRTPGPAPARALTARRGAAGATAKGGAPVRSAARVPATREVTVPVPGGAPGVTRAVAGAVLSGLRVEAGVEGPPAPAPSGDNAKVSPKALVRVLIAPAARTGRPNLSPIGADLIRGTISARNSVQPKMTTTSSTEKGWSENGRNGAPSTRSCYCNTLRCSSSGCGYSGWGSATFWSTYRCRGSSCYSPGRGGTCRS